MGVGFLGRDAGACAVERVRGYGEDGGRVTERGGRLAGGEADLALRHRKARDGIQKADDLLAFVAEVFGDGEGQPSGAAAAGRGFI